MDTLLVAVAERFKMGHLTLTTSSSGVVYHPMVNQCAKFEVSIFTIYEDMTRDAKCRKWDALGVVRSHSRSVELAPLNTAYMNTY